MMLKHLGEHEAAQRIQEGIEQVYREGRALTPDVGGRGTTSEFSAAVIQAMGKAVPARG